MVDRLLEWVRSLPKKFLDWWEKFTPRQKRTIVSLAVGVIVAFAIMIAVLSQPKYIKIYTATSLAEAQSVIELLEAEGYTYITSEDGLEISVEEDDYTTVNLYLGSNSIYTDAFGIDNVTEGGLSTTESDRQKRYVVYLEGLIESSLATYSFVKDATVHLNIAEDNGTLIAQNQDSSASVILNLSGECSMDTAAALAQFVATALGNESTKNVVILDTDGNLLFSGSDESSTYGTASTQMALTEQISNIIKNDVRSMLIGTNEFSQVEVAANIVLDNSYTEYAEHLYWAPDGREEGMLASEDLYESNSSGGISGIPGTDSNTESTYVYEDGEYSNAYTEEESRDYLPNESTTLQQIPAGSIKYDESSLTVTCLTYNIIHEEDIERQGLLDGITWEDYKLNNGSRVKMEVDEDLYRAVSTATGIDVDNITIIAYEEPMFMDREGLDIDRTDILQIILIVLILALLAFVIYRSMKQQHVEEEEAEINIDDILQSTPVEEINEIGVEDKSEARKIIEKFVDDNPEAAASLLRNWLTEDWD